MTDPRFDVARARRLDAWPDREAFVRWGMQPCKTTGCRVLLNPGIGYVFCGLCRTRHKARRR